MASVVKRRLKSGLTAFQVRWRDPDVGHQQSVTFSSETEARLLKLFLDGNGQSFSAAQQFLLESQRKVPTVAQVIQEYLDSLVRPASGTLRTYQTMLDLHIGAFLGSVAVGELGIHHLTQWVWEMQGKGKSAKTIRNNHALISSSMEMAVRLGYRVDNPCHDMRLPVGEKIKEDVQFLTPTEFGFLFASIPEPYKAFTLFLVMTGTRFGEATAVTVGDLDTVSVPALVRITKAWKRDGNNQYYVGPTKTVTGRRTVSLPPDLVEALTPLVSGRQESDLLFTSSTGGGRITHNVYWQSVWLPAVKAAQAAGLRKTPRIHDLRHTHASWLIQDRVSLFTISRRLGHASTRTTESIYGHLMPQALQDAADAMQRSATKWKQ